MAPLPAGDGPPLVRDVQSLRSARYRYVCADALELLWAVLRADRTTLWAHGDPPRFVLAVGRDACLLSGAGSAAPGPAWPTQPAYSPDARTLLLPCADGAGRVVALAQVTGVRAIRSLPAAGLTAMGAVLACTVSGAAGGAGAGPAKEGRA